LNFNLAIELYIYIIFFLPPNVTSVVQPLDWGAIASFKVQYKKELLEWVLSQFASSIIHCDLRILIPIVRQVVIVLSSVERDESPNHTKQLEDVQHIICIMECQFCHE